MANCQLTEATDDTVNGRESEVVEIGVVGGERRRAAVVLVDDAAGSGLLALGHLQLGGDAVDVDEEGDDGGRTVGRRDQNRLRRRQGVVQLAAGAARVDRWRRRRVEVAGEDVRLARLQLVQRVAVHVATLVVVGGPGERCALRDRLNVPRRRQRVNWRRNGALRRRRICW